MGKLKDAKLKAALLVNSLFRGMKAADDVITSQSKDDADGQSINQQVKPGGVFADLLEQKMTQEVIELRDKNYRILREADKYVPNISLSEDENGQLTFKVNSIKKKTKEDYMKHPPVFEEDGYKLRTIQQNRHVEKKRFIVSIGEEISPEDMPTGIYDYDTTLTVERDGFSPRIEIEKFVTKMVVRNDENNPEHAIVDLYCPSEASQFGKIDAILIANLYQIWETKNLRSDITDLMTIKWFSDHGWNTDDVCLFEYDNVKFKGINIFDGSFVLSYDCHIVHDGAYLAEKFKTKELDEKYEAKAPKGDVNIFSAKRRAEKDDKDKNNEIDIENLGPTTFKL